MDDRSDAGVDGSVTSAADAAMPNADAAMPGTDAAPSTDAAPGTDAASDVCTPGGRCLAQPESWAVVTFHEGAQAACPNGAQEIRRGGTSPPASLSCTPCACATATCSNATMDLDSATSDCTSAVTTTIAAPPNACVNTTQGNVIYSEKLILGTTSCPASGGQKQAFAWGTNAVTCTPSPRSGTCTNGTCFARPMPGAVCLSRDGDVACPGTTDTKHLFHTGVIDTTSCGTCTCAGNTLPCSGSANIYFSADCANPFTTVNPLPAGCRSTPGALIKSISTVVVPATCTPSGGEASGAIAVDPAKAVTVCCPADP